jgi:hypothetical protein
MRKQLFTLLVGAMLLSTTSTKAQIIDLVNDWTTTALPLGPTGTGFMDYTDDSCMFGFTTSPESSGVGILDTNGVPVTYPDLTVLDLTSEVQAVQVVDNHTYVSFFDEADAIFGLIRMDNDTYGIAQVETAIPALYEEFTYVNCLNNNLVEETVIFVYMKAKNTSTGKWTSLLLKHTYNKITNEFSEGQFIEINMPGKDTYPSKLLNFEFTDIVFTAYFDGGNTDILVTRIDENGEILYKKTISGYPGKDDLPIDLVKDNSNNVFCIAQSEDNVGANNHIAVIKINPNTGKAVWTKRVGEATPGSETVVCASGNTLGGGLAFAGNVTDGAAGRNAKIWRMNAAGNVLWNKTINNAAPGNFESCSDILFDESNGDVYAFGTTADNIFISRYQSTTGSSGYIKLDDIKGEKVKGETSFGDVVCSILSNDGTSYYLTISKYSEINLRLPENVEATNNINCFPNPANALLTITGLKENTDLQIINATGQVVFTQNVSANKLDIDLEQLPVGFYTVLINNEGIFETKGFVKM